MKNNIFTNNFVILKEKPIVITKLMFLWMFERKRNLSPQVMGPIRLKQPQWTMDPRIKTAKVDTGQATSLHCKKRVRSYFVRWKGGSNKTRNQTAFTTKGTAFLGIWSSKRRQERLGPYFYLHRIKGSLWTWAAKKGRTQLEPTFFFRPHFILFLFFLFFSFLNFFFFFLFIMKVKNMRDHQ